jgi:3-dehydroquinate dehydratase/shikimate dehydrogenase
MAHSTDRSRVIPSVLERDAAAAAQIVTRSRKSHDLVELRADHLRADAIGSVVRQVGGGLIVTARRRDAGGAFDGSEEERRALLRTALDAGAEYIDLEHGGALADLLDDPAIAARVILSAHGDAPRFDSLLQLYREMAATDAAVVKIVPQAEQVADTLVIHDLLREAASEEGRLVCFALGRAGALSRLLAPSWGSWATYAAARRGAETAPGQFDADEMGQVHGVLEIGPETRRFALIGSRVFRSPSPAMHRAAYAAAKIDARYLPLEIDELEELQPLLERRAAFGLDALAVTMPLKSAAAARCDELDELAATSGAVNTVLIENDRWRGFNTDGPAALELIRDRVEPRGARAAVLGAGGTAAAVAATLHRAGAEVMLFNRTRTRAQATADRIGVQSAPLGELDRFAWDLLINATPQGSHGESFLPAERLTGRLVLDAVYHADSTPLVHAARQRGLEAIDGFELLCAQAELQFRHMTGAAPPPGRMAAGGMQWLRDHCA